MKNKFINAFTAAELAITLVIIGFIIKISMTSIYYVDKTSDSIKLKNAYLNLGIAINNLIKNPVYYSEEDGFADTNTVTVDGYNYGQNFKFEQLLSKELQINNSYTGDIACSMMRNKKEIMSASNYCHKTENGVVWAIPNTDFRNADDSSVVVQAQNASGFLSNYVPITIYPSEKDVKKSNAFEEYAIVVGVRLDGRMIFLNTVDCENKKNKEYNQCKIAKYITKAKMSNED